MRDQTVAVIDRITASLGSFAQFLAGQAGGLVASAARLVFSLVITLGVLFFLLRDAVSFARAVRQVLPFGAEQNARLSRMAYELVFASVTASLAIAAIQGVIGGVTFALLGIQGAVLWGVMMTLLAFLPLIGAALVWAPAAIWLRGSSRCGGISSRTSLRAPRSTVPWRRVELPHTWNAFDAVDNVPGYRRGTGWYRKMFQVGRWPGRVLLVFEGVNISCDVFVNGRRAGGSGAAVPPARPTRRSAITGWAAEGPSRRAGSPASYRRRDRQAR